MLSNLAARPGPAWCGVAVEIPGSEEGALARRVAGGGGVPAPRRAPDPRTPAGPRRRECVHTHAHSHTHARLHTPAPAPALPLGGDPPRRQPRLRLPACVYNFVLLPRPPCSCKGGGGMWKAAAPRLTGGTSGGLRRRPERPLVAVPWARAEACVLPPRP